MPRRLDGVKRMLAVASGKGGVGKTTVTVNLALALAQRGARVGLFDADIYGPNVPLMLGIQQTKTSRGMLTVARAGRVPYIDPLLRYGLKVMSIGLLVAERETIAPDPRYAGMIVSQTLQDVRWGELDVLLIDLPPGTGEPQQSLVNVVTLDGALVVTTPQDLSLLDAGRALGLFRQANVPILGIVENMSYLRCPHCGEPIEVFHRSERNWQVEDAALEVLGRIPIGLAISRGIDAGHPLLQATPTGDDVTAFREIAERVAQKLGNA